MTTPSEIALPQTEYESITVVGESEVSLAVDEDDESEEGVEKRIMSAKKSLAARLGEIERRVDNVKDKAKDMANLKHWIKNPWIPLGAGVVAGYMFGRGGGKRSGFSPALSGAVTAVAGALLKQVLHGVVSDEKST